MANKSIKDSFQRFWQHCVSSFATKEYVDNAVGGGGGSVELDTTLTQAGKAADAKAVGDRLAFISSGGGGGGGGGAVTKSFQLTYDGVETTETHTILKFSGVTNTVGNKYLTRFVSKLTAYGQTLAVQIQNTQAVVGTGYDAGTIMYNIGSGFVFEPIYAFLEIHTDKAHLVFENAALSSAEAQTIVGTIQYSDYIRVDYEEV